MGEASDADSKDSSATLIEQAAQKLEEGDPALIMMVDESDEVVLDRALLKYNVVIIRYDAEVIAKAVETAGKRSREISEARNEDSFASVVTEERHKPSPCLSVRRYPVRFHSSFLIPHS